MAKPVSIAFNAVCEAKRNANFGQDTFVDGRTFLQDQAVRTIFRTYSVRAVVQLEYTPPFLNYTVHLNCNRLVLFKINELGLFTLKTIPVWGGNNTPYSQPILQTKISQKSCF